MLKNRDYFMEKTGEALRSVLPITLIVLLLCFTISPMKVDALMAFLLGAVMLVIGMSFFTMGAELAMTPMGERIGSEMTKTRRLSIVMFVSFVIGVMITISEPDLQVLAAQIPTMPSNVIIVSVAIGVGFFLMLALLRILLAIPIVYLLTVLYVLVFVVAMFVPSEFWAIAFDSGGVTTGPMTVPFIMAMGIGVSSIRNDQNAEEDSFGLVAISSVGPILAVLVLGMIYNTESMIETSVVVLEAETSVELIWLFTVKLPVYMMEVGKALLPIIVFFGIFQCVRLRLRWKPLRRILMGIVYAYMGLVLFLTGVNVGFMPAGMYLGGMLARLPIRWIIIPISMVIGYFIVAAEPAVHVLTKQVEEITSGAISEKALQLSLSLGVAVSLGLAMIRVMTGISILWFLVPGYALALLVSFKVPKIFTSIAFDSGGVASGPMTATFILPFSMGACEALGGHVVTDAFGVIAMVAMTPLVTIQMLGCYYKRKNALRANTVPVLDLVQVDHEEIIDFM